MAFQPHGTDRLGGVMIASREHMETPGLAGGFPGGTTNIEVLRKSGEVERISAQADDVQVFAGDEFSFRMSSSGGYGDPLDREPSAVLEDVICERMTLTEAEKTYGVVIVDRAVDVEATGLCRKRILAWRLENAEAPLRAVGTEVLLDNCNGPELPLYPGVVQRGGVAISKRSGAPLAIAPHRWTDGCPVLRSSRMTRPGIQVYVNAYLDPRTGASLCVDSLPEGEAISFESCPDRWRVG